MRTTDVVESSFATVRSKDVSQQTTHAMIFKLAEAAEKSWRRLNGQTQLPKIILGIKFTDGIEAQVAAA
jgi:putative transposase